MPKNATGGLRRLGMPVFDLTWTVMALLLLAAVVTAREPNLDGRGFYFEIMVLAVCVVAANTFTGCYGRSFFTRRIEFARLALSAAVSLVVVELCHFVLGRSVVPAELKVAVILLTYVGIAAIRARAISNTSGSSGAQAVKPWGAARSIEITGSVPIGSVLNSNPADTILAMIRTLLRNIRDGHIAAARSSGSGRPPMDRAVIFATSRNINHSAREVETGRIAVQENSFLRAEIAARNHHELVRSLLKRALDVVVSLAILLLTLPLTLIVALLIHLTDQGPVFYRQRRVGLDAREFMILKFRSMRIDAEADGKPRWSAVGDPRITPIGRFLRRSRIDEIPQVWNILRGDMSLVGPRPERPEIVREMNQTIPLYELRHRVKPGLTGWAQINFPYGASLNDTIEKTSYDLYYIKNDNILLDLIIMFVTVPVVLFGQGGR